MARESTPIHIMYVAYGTGHYIYTMYRYRASSHYLQDFTFHCTGQRRKQKPDITPYINGNTTSLNNSFSKENEKRAAQVGLESTTYCLLGRCSTTKLLRQLNGWVESKQYKERVIGLT